MDVNTQHDGQQNVGLFSYIEDKHILSFDYMSVLKTAVILCCDGVIFDDDADDDDDDDDDTDDDDDEDDSVWITSHIPV